MENRTFTIWKRKSKEALKEKVFSSLRKNVNFDTANVLGLPASYLDQEVFSSDNNLLKDAPFLTALVHNPNHIGCHTLGDSESYFDGTHQIEKELIEICSVDILNAKPNSCDGYVASGGTEANIQAMWMYRNYFLSELSAKNSEICILCSEDSHYSMNKGANLLQVDLYQYSVHSKTRLGTLNSIEFEIKKAKNDGKKYFIVVANMMTTMYGSVDELEPILSGLKKHSCTYKIHVDGAYGGFYYPFTNSKNKLNFSNPNISSITLDAHKMCQAPYGTGIFLAKKGLIKFTGTSASYVKGNDFTLIGSRSGANAIAVWMILSTHGPFRWIEKTFILQKRTEWLCSQLNELGMEYYRNEFSNIVTMNWNESLQKLSSKFGLVPDDHNHPKCYKIVIMEHVTIEKLELFVTELELELIQNQQPVLI